MIYQVILSYLFWSLSRVEGSLICAEDTFGYCGNNSAMCSTACRAIQNLQNAYYEEVTVNWAKQGWWNTANTIEALVNYVMWSKDVPNNKEYLVSVIDRVLAYQAPYNQTNINYYDDPQWWALAYLRAYEMSDYSTNWYLKNGEYYCNYAWDHAWDNVTCEGGMFWNFQKTYKNAITNELGLACQCKLHYLTPDRNETYRHRCELVYSWLLETVDMINSSLGLFNDGLNDTTCLNNNGLTWTYNQGVILLGLEYMSRIDPLRYLNASVTIAKHLLYGVIDHLIQVVNTSNSNLPHARILREVVNATQIRSNTDHEQFKGIWMRYASYYFKYLVELDIEPQLRKDLYDFVHQNWYYGLLTYAKAPQDGIFLFDSVWYENYQYSDGVSQTSAIDAFNAAFVFL